MFFVGIDEAGYGPILGPLVIGGLMLRCACRPSLDFLWRELSDVIAGKPSRKEARLVVCDSKMLSSRPDGLPLLETAGLVAARLAGVPNSGRQDLLTGLDPQVSEHLAACPWDAGDDTPLPCACKPESLAIQVHAVRAAARRIGCSFAAAGATILPPVRYNSLLDRTGNKATVLWVATTWLLHRFLKQAAALDPSEPVFAVLDRQGGRTDYRPALQQSFEPEELAVLEQTPECGRYHMSLPLPHVTARQHVDVTFLTDADLGCCTTAWGSVIAKYVREICMARLNDWWRARVENLEPTAGYLPDGRRFIRQAQPHFKRLGISTAAMIRQR